MTDKMDEFKNLYISTARELVQNILSETEHLSSNDVQSAGLKNLHRYFHSLKSQSKTMGYEQIASICLACEEFLKDKSAISQSSIKELDTITKQISYALDRIEKGDSEPIDESVISRARHLSS